MATQSQINLRMSAGTSFEQTFSVLIPDGSAVDITGYTFYAKMAKHESALNAEASTAGAPVWRYVEMTTAISDAAAGKYTISLADTINVKLEEGKYVFSVVMEDLATTKSEVISGLVFVDRGFAHTGSYGTIDSNYP